jgi:uncharacterized protein YecE (DUF72 family)
VFGWAKHTPQDYKFSVKLNRLITHEKMLDMARGVLLGIKRQKWEFSQYTGKVEA